MNENDNFNKIKSTVIEVLFNKVEDYADTLFDIKDRIIPDDTLKFLKNTQLSQLKEYENMTEDDRFFVISNGEQSIKFSNRSSSNGEFRGAVLRNFLDEQKVKNPTKSLYDAIQGYITTLDCDAVKNMKSFLCQGLMEHDVKMTQAHVDILSAILLDKIKSQSIIEQYSAKDVRDSEEIQNQIWSEAALQEGLYYKTKILGDKIQSLKDKVGELSKFGYLEAHPEGIGKLHAKLLKECDDISKEMKSPLYASIQTQLHSQLSEIKSEIDKLSTSGRLEKSAQLISRKLSEKKANQLYSIMQKEFQPYIETMRKKEKALREEGHTHAADFVRSRYTELSQNIESLKNPRRSWENFIKDCKSCVEESSGLKLKNDQDVSLETFKLEGFSEFLDVNAMLNEFFEEHRSTLIHCLEQIENKAEKLGRSGHIEAQQAAMDLHDGLIAAIKDLAVSDSPNLNDFVDKCNNLIENAEKSALKDHRNLFSKLWHYIRGALSVIIGKPDISPTESIQKTHELKRAIDAFRETPVVSEQQLDDKKITPGKVT